MKSPNNINSFISRKATRKYNNQSGNIVGFNTKFSVPKQLEMFIRQCEELRFRSLKQEGSPFGTGRQTFFNSQDPLSVLIISFILVTLKCGSGVLL